MRKTLPCQKSHAGAKHRKGKQLLFLEASGFQQVAGGVNRNLVSGLVMRAIEVYLGSVVGEEVPRSRCLYGEKGMSRALEGTTLYVDRQALDLHAVSNAPASVAQLAAP